MPGLALLLMIAAPIIWAAQGILWLHSGKWYPVTLLIIFGAESCPNVGWIGLGIILCLVLNINAGFISMFAGYVVISIADYVERNSKP